MSKDWYEVWADGSLATPYVLLVMPDPKGDGGVVVRDPKEGLKVVYAGMSYANAKDWLLEDEYTRVEGRVERDE